MEATNQARATHGDALAPRLAGGALAKELRQAARHPAAHRGTTHVSVIDADGTAAAVSLSNGEGNGFIVGKFGFMLNNMLGEEDLAGALGDWRPGTRLSSMMAPTIILQADGTVTALGTGGSNRIRTAILQVAVNLLDHGMGLDTAVEASRLHVERDGKTSFEPGLPRADRARFACARRAGACVAETKSVFRWSPRRSPPPQWRRRRCRRSSPPRHRDYRVTVSRETALARDQCGLRCRCFLFRAMLLNKIRRSGDRDR